MVEMLADDPSVFSITVDEFSDLCRDAARYRKLKADDVDIYFCRTGTNCQSFELDEVLDADGQATHLPPQPQPGAEH